MTNHYSRQIGYQQKVQALMDRKELQARDTFDLDLLLASGVLLSTTGLQPSSALKGVF